MTDLPQTPPIRSTWSSLQCLAALAVTPPSPTSSPTTTARQKRLTSGEIPFILDSGIDAPTSPISGTTYRTQTPRRTSQYSMLTIDHSEHDLPHNSSIGGLWDTVRVGSRTSINTFGLARSPSFVCDSNPPPVPDLSPDLRYFSPSLIPSATPTFATPSTPDLAGTSPNLTLGNCAGIPTTTSPLTTIPTVPQNAAMSFEMHGMEPDSGLDEDAADETVHIALGACSSTSDETVSTYFTACGNLPKSDSASSGISFLTLDDAVSVHASDLLDPRDNSAVVSNNHRKSVHTEYSIAFAPPSPALSVASLHPPPRAPPRKVARQVAIRRSAQMMQRNESHPPVDDSHHQMWSPMVFSQSGTQIHARTPSNSSASSISVPSSDSHAPLDPSLTAHSLNLPPHLTWLETIRVELMIDQEGFREARPVFKLVGMQAANGGQAHAEFKPCDIRPFQFHHSGLDPNPLLRRLIVDGDEEHDAFSRLAVLPLKGEGVYSVTGSETPRPPTKVTQGGSFHPFNGDLPFGSGVKLTWKFVYVVSARISPTTGKPMPGEKTLTPLSFSCSPRLLHANIGHRVGLLQLARKAARPKLMAQRMGPPKPPTSTISLSAQVRTWARSKENQPPRSAWSNEHSRETSAASSDGGRNDDEKSLLRPASGRRRAASAASSQLPGRVFGHPFASGFALVDQNAQHPSNHLLDRHILSQAELASLIKTPATKAPPTYALPRLPPGFEALTPPPLASKSLNARVTIRAAEV
jgi:hypothetical protein